MYVQISMTQGPEFLSVDLKPAISLRFWSENKVTNLGGGEGCVKDALPLPQKNWSLYFQIKISNFIIFLNKIRISSRRTTASFGGVSVSPSSSLNILWYKNHIRSSGCVRANDMTCGVSRTTAQSFIPSFTSRLQPVLVNFMFCQ